MLKPSYNAIKQFQRQISTIHTLEELKILFRASKVSLSIRISSPTIWVLDWDVLGNSVSGTLEVRLEPTMRMGKDTFVMQESSFLLNDPHPHRIKILETRLMEQIKQLVAALES